MRATLIDYGAGNLPSVEHALQQLGAATERATLPEQIDAATALVLPGVGHFGAMMHTLETLQLTRPIRAALARKVPFLGICLGMQALYIASEEAEGVRGFEMFPAMVTALPREVRLPHIGWNQVQQVHESRLLRGVPDHSWFYFAHTFAVPAEPGRAGAKRVLEMRPAAAAAAPRPVERGAGVVATCRHGHAFVAAVEQENLHAVQFHPEKSAAAGHQVLRNFLELAR